MPRELQTPNAFETKNWNLCGPPRQWPWRWRPTVRSSDPSSSWLAGTIGRASSVILIKFECKTFRFEMRIKVNYFRRSGSIAEKWKTSSGKSWECVWKSFHFDCPTLWWSFDGRCGWTNPTSGKQRMWRPLATPTLTDRRRRCHCRCSCSKSRSLSRRLSRSSRLAMAIN